MPYKIQLQDARNSGILRSISNVGTASQAFVDLLNEAQEGLGIRGKWFDLEQRIKFCLSSNCVVWPEFVGTILAVKSCNGLASVQNQWYSFVDNYFGSEGTGFGGLGSGYGYDGFYRSGGGSRCVIEDYISRSCYNEITGTTGKIIQYSVVKNQDLGKKITLYGKKYGGQPLQELDASGNWVDGLTLTAATPYVRTTDLITEITSVTREATQGMTYLYEYDSSTGKLKDLAAYSQNETNPRYRTSRILNMPTGKKDSNGVCWTSIEALVKLKFIPVVDERDFLFLDNLRAVKFAMQAIIAERANQDQEAIVKWAQAVGELNLELDDRKPKRQVPVRMNLGRTISSPI